MLVPLTSPMAAATLAMKAPMSIDKAVQNEASDAALRAASAVWRAFTAAAFNWVTD